jgi:hydrogenase nickel incorporation protein HypA/HybF
MHEWALAEGVMTTALQAGEKAGLKSIRRISIKIGELQRIDREVFRGALEAVKPDDARLAATELALEIEPSRFRCRPCKAEFTLAEAGGPLGGDPLESIHFIPELAHAFMACPRCDSPDFEVIQGRGVWIEDLEGD